MIVLAAGKGTRLRPLADTRPKCLVELNGRPLLDWQVDAAHAAGITDVTVVGGYLWQQLEDHGADVAVNPNYDTTNMVFTLFCAEDCFGEGFVMSYGDIVYSQDVLRTLLLDTSPVGVIVDLDWRGYWEQRFEDPLSDAESLRIGANGRIMSIGQREADIDLIDAQYIGLVAFRGEGVEALRQTYQAARAGEWALVDGGRPVLQMFMTDLLQAMIDLGHPVNAVPINGGWVEVDSLDDLALAEELFSRGRLRMPVVE
jgi:choline kinase